MGSPSITYSQRVVAAVQAAVSEKGVTSYTLAQQAGIPRTTLDRRLAGVDPFKLDELERIAAALDVPVESLAAPEVAA